MNNSINMTEYMNNGIENIVNGIIRASLRNPRETAGIVPCLRRYSLLYSKS